MSYREDVKMKQKPELFPSPLEVNGGGYLDCFLSEDAISLKFPYPFEVTGVSYQIKFIATFQNSR